MKTFIILALCALIALPNKALGEDAHLREENLAKIMEECTSKNKITMDAIQKKDYFLVTGPVQEDIKKFWLCYYEAYGVLKGKNLNADRLVEHLKLDVLKEMPNRVELAKTCAAKATLGIVQNLKKEEDKAFSIAFLQEQCIQNYMDQQEEEANNGNAKQQKVKNTQIKDEVKKEQKKEISEHMKDAKEQKLEKAN